jgi:hypothetical protein
MSGLDDRLLFAGIFGVIALGVALPIFGYHRVYSARRRKRYPHSHHKPASVSDSWRKLLWQVLR